MKRLTTIVLFILASLLGLSVLVSAIDVKPSTDSTQPAQIAHPTIAHPEKTALPLMPTTPSGSSGGNLLDRLKKQVHQPEKVKATKYDDFIDEDGDGVDDRLAKGTKLKEAPPREKPAPASTETKGKVKRTARKATPPKEKP